MSPSVINKLLSTSLFFTFSLCCCIGQISKITYQTIMTQDAETIIIDIKGDEVEIKETKGTRILVETLVKLSLPNEALLNFVIESGRYQLIKKYNSSTRELSLKSKKNRNIIIVKGNECQEEIKYKIYIPLDLHILQP